jgi:hypothetical protein
VVVRRAVLGPHRLDPVAGVLDDLRSHDHPARAEDDGDLPVIGCTTEAQPRDPAAGRREPVRVVSERLGHAQRDHHPLVNEHVDPGMGRQGADRFAALLDG